MLYLKSIRKLTTCGRIIDFALQRYPQRSYLLFSRSTKKITFNQLSARIKNLRSYFRKIPLKEEEVVAFSARNCAEFFEIRAACHKEGLIFLGLPPHLGTETLIYFLQRAQAKVLFFREHSSFNEAQLRQRIKIEHMIGLDSPEYEGIFTAAEVVGRKERENPKTGSTATLNLSSGTTAKIPKIVRLSDENWVASAYNSLRNADLRLGKRLIVMAAVPYLTSGSTTFIPSLLAGAAHVIFEDELSAGGIAEAVQKHTVNVLYITPSWLIELYEWCLAHNERLTSLSAIIVGTERMPPARLKEAVGFFGPIIQLGYGMVEALPPVSLLLPQDYAKVNSLGRIAKGVKVKVLQDKIVIKSKTVSAGYLDNPEENSRCFKGGWFLTSDFGSVDKDGFLYLSGRKEEIIAEIPRRVFAREIEDLLYQMHWVKRAAVIRVDSNICAFVSTRGKMERNEAIKKVKEHCAVSVKDIPCPDIVIIKEHLPINELGKLDRQALAKEIR